mgnify:CR=1 FL=1
MNKAIKAVSLALALVMILGVTAVYLSGSAVVGSDGTLTPGPSGDKTGPVGGTTDPSNPALPTPPVDGTTSLEVCKYAEGCWERWVVYDWEIRKTVVEKDGVMVTDYGHLGKVTIPEGETASVFYKVEANRHIVCEEECMGVRGYVTVRNTGPCPTENLKIVDHIQVWDEESCYYDVEVFGIDTSRHPVLAPGEECTYYYEYAFEGVPGMTYRNLACVSITNYDGCDGEERAVGAEDCFTVPGEPHLVEEDETAVVVDEIYCPEDLSCVASDNGPWIFYEPGTAFFSVDVTNLGASCEQDRCLVNKVTLVEQDTCQVREDCAYVSIQTGPCECLTTITVEKTAELVWKKTIEYDWTVNKSFEVVQENDVERVLTADVVLPTGETVKVCYTITADRQVALVEQEFDLMGYVKVCNTGCCPTEGLVIHDVFSVIVNGEKYDYEFDVSTAPMPVLGPGKCFYYPYQVDVTEFLLEVLGEVNGDSVLPEMENRAFAGISNFDGFEGVHYVKAKVGVEAPEPEIEYIDEAATVTDLETFPDGFDVDMVAGPWFLYESGKIEFCKNVTNVDAECGKTYYLNDTAVLVESDTGEVREDSESVVIRTPECECRTTITVEKDAELDWNATVYYQWNLTKDADVENENLRASCVQLDKEESVLLSYEIRACFWLDRVDIAYAVDGYITVCNTGDCPTEGLSVVDKLVIKIGDHYFVTEEFDVDTSAKPVLGAGECYDYPYSVSGYFSVSVSDIEEHTGEENVNSAVLGDFLEMLDITNSAKACITNFEGYGEHCVYDNITVDKPEPIVYYYDECITVEDELACPAGFTCVPDGDYGPWNGTVFGVQENGCYFFNYAVEVTNEDAECNETFYVNNTATLTTCDSETEVSDSASVCITTPECECGGCTRTIGYWKNHDGSGPQDDEITPLIAAAGGTIWLGTPNGAESVAITTAAQAAEYLNKDGDASNGINRLYAQLLAAKLNILSGACDDAVDDTIAAADAFLATHGADDWENLTQEQQQQVNAWKDTLDQYNNGVIGPGHCSDED